MAWKLWKHRIFFDRLNLIIIILRTDFFLSEICIHIVLCVYYHTQGTESHRIHLMFINSWNNLPQRGYEYEICVQCESMVMRRPHRRWLTRFREPSSQVHGEWLNDGHTQYIYRLCMLVEPALEPWERANHMNHNWPGRWRETWSSGCVYMKHNYGVGRWCFTAFLRITHIAPLPNRGCRNVFDCFENWLLLHCAGSFVPTPQERQFST